MRYHSIHDVAAGELRVIIKKNFELWNGMRSS